MQKTLLALILGILIGVAIGYFLWGTEGEEGDAGRGDNEWPAVTCSNGMTAQEMLIAIKVKASGMGQPAVATAAQAKLDATYPAETIEFHSTHTVNAFSAAYPAGAGGPVNWTVVQQELEMNP